MMSADRISISQFLSLRSGGKRVNTADALTYLYLTFGTVLMFGPVLWLVASSFKTQAGLVKYPPPLLPYQQVQVEVEGFDDALPLFTVAMEDGSSRELAQIRRVGIEARMIDPADPAAGEIKVNIRQREPVEEVKLAWENYLDQLVELENFDFVTYLKNSVLVTTMATAITLVINSMAAFALSKYQFKGRDAIFVLFISTLMIPDNGYPGAGFPGHHHHRLEEQLMGRDHPRRGDADGHLPAAPIYADHPRRIAGCRAD